MTTHPTILFDSFCNLCDGSIRFLMARDRTAYFRFAALQSEAGRDALRTAGADPAAIASIVVIDAAGVHRRSDAVLRIAAGLPAPWRALAALRIIPASLRDRVYDAIASNRHRWFGSRRQCVVPTAAQRERFL
jgi:predicted DCC family thiol-disulfide oxidoreductase YuxK